MADFLYHRSSRTSSLPELVWCPWICQQFVFVAATIILAHFHFAACGCPSFKVLAATAQTYPMTLNITPWQTVYPIFPGTFEAVGDLAASATVGRNVLLFGAARTRRCR